MTSPADKTSLIWLRPEPSGRKPRYTREQIARTALTIADAEGFEAVTMKRIATELGAATMTLYYYVRTKVDIVALMQDAILEDVLIPAHEFPDDWRRAVSDIARRTRDVLVHHPWAISSLGDAQFGPNALRHYEQSLAALSPTGLTTAQKIAVTAIFDDYVLGSAAHTVETRERLLAAARDPRLVTDAQAYGEAMMATGQFPHLASLAASEGNPAEQDDPIDPDTRLTVQFEIGLAALLDGLARHYNFDPQ